MIKKMAIVIRAFQATEGRRQAKRSPNVGLGGAARKAMEKSWAEVGEEHVTMMNGRYDFSDFSVTRGNVKCSKFQSPVVRHTKRSGCQGVINTSSKTVKEGTVLELKFKKK